MTGIAADLLTMLKSFLHDMPVFKNIPFYIFCESYGGKMTSAFGVTLYQAIQKGDIQMNFVGVALGDSSISPVDTALTYGPYLYSFSLLDQTDLEHVNDLTNQTAQAFYSGDYEKSVKLFAKTMQAIGIRTDYADYYNVLLHIPPPRFQDGAKTFKDQHLGHLYWQHVGRLQPQSLSDFMNGPVRNKLGIIPDDVTWGGQSRKVYEKQIPDLLKPTVMDVTQLVNSGLMVVVYEGQLDMICDTIGAEVWINKLAWPGLKQFSLVRKVPLYAPSQEQTKNTGAFLKEYENFHFYIILNAGHMVPVDTPEMALSMVNRILAHEEMNKI